MVDSISRIASAFESARELTLEAAAVAASRLGESSYHRYSQSITPEGLRSLLNSRNSREVRDGMKRVASLMACDDPTINLESYFADVVKNVSSDDVKVKRLVAIYMLRYAEKDPGLALLAVNSVQRSLSDPDSEVRSLALKAISDIKIPSLYPIVLHSVKKAITDAAADVRCAVGFALLKLYREQREELTNDILPLLQDLLADLDPEVVSSAIILMKEAFPDHLELLHGHFRRYCGLLPQLCEWSQLYLIELFAKYCKCFIPKPILVDSSDASLTVPLSDDFTDIPFAVYNVSYHADLSLFLDSMQKLLHSQNAAVVVAISKAYFELTPPLTFKNSKAADALVRLIAVPSVADGRALILQCILVYCAVDPSTFSRFLNKFFLFPSDDTNTAIAKLKILSTLVDLNNVKRVVSEIKYYIANDQRPAVIQEALNTLAGCGQLSRSLSLHITKWLLTRMVGGISSASLDSFVSVLRSLIQENPTEHLHTMLDLSRVLRTQDNLSGTAKAGIVWLFGEFSSINFIICPDVLRVLIPNFSREPKEVRLQIVLLAAKLLSWEIDNSRNSSTEGGAFDAENSRTAQMARAVFYLAKFDDDFDIRDRSRLFCSLFDNERYEIASLLLQAPKPSSIAPMTLHMPLSGNASSFASLGLDPDTEDYLTFCSWTFDGDADESSALRAPAQTKDYSRMKTSFSSSTFFGAKTGNNFSRDSPAAQTSDGAQSHASRDFTSSAGRKYKLQSLDEFFSDIPVKDQRKRRVIVEEESSDEGEISQEASESDDISVSSSTESDTESEIDVNT
ncbi:LAQU0S05e06172g1_1 [Lachancea quebecensis]|uniref:LAQU0S05e06172g1_1 n=1 Tax=Lachancea quebecensis TaxID=1654605 RepID=A0A0P1KS05_9SACH|nr:LAQU0S05e06172g1_1 [Lachancea quebecensis]